MKGRARRTCHAVSLCVCKLLSVQTRGSFTAAGSMQTAVFTHIGHVPVNHFVARVMMLQQRLYFQAKLVMIVPKLDKSVSVLAGISLTEM